MSYAKVLVYMYTHFFIYIFPALYILVQFCVIFYACKHVCIAEIKKKNDNIQNRTHFQESTF